MKHSVLNSLKTSATIGRLSWAVAISTILFAAHVLGATAKPTKPANPLPETKAATNAPVVFVVPLSEFVDDFKTGRDPFFPSSQRRNPPDTTRHKGTGMDTNPPPSLVVVSPKSFLAMLTLKGISKGAKGRKFAVISDYTFAPGESFFVRLSGARYRVKCEEIRDQTVVISVEGVEATRTLYMKQAEVLDAKKTPDLKPK